MIMVGLADGRILKSKIAMPDHLTYVSPPVHPLFGDLTKGASIPDIQASLQSLLPSEGALPATTTDNQGLPILDELNIQFLPLEVAESGEQALDQVHALQRYTHMETA